MQIDDWVLIENFINKFVPKHRQARWQTLLQGSPHKWCKLSIDDIWSNVSKLSNLKQINLEKYLSVNKELNTELSMQVMLSGDSGILKGLLSEILNGIVYSDALIFVPSKNICLISHHDEQEWLMCTFL